MANGDLPAGERRRGQRVFYGFNSFNVISFNFLSGNIITLLALRLGATPTLVGLLASFVPLAQLLPLLGRRLVRHLGTVRLMGIFWAVRYLFMIPIGVAPWVADSLGTQGVLVVCVLSVLGFNFCRGIAITAYNPIVGAVTTQQDRGHFLSRSALIVHSMSIVTGISIALILRGETPLHLFSVVTWIGITSGLIASLFLFRLPEPRDTSRAIRRPFMSSLTRAFRRTAFRNFVALHFFTLFTLFMITPFLIVFMKTVYGQGDNTVVVFTVMGSLGAVTTALLSGFMIDRLGAKPLYVIFSGVALLALILPIVSPELSPGGALLWVYAGGMFYLYNMGLGGITNSAYIYFFALVDPEERLNLGVVYFMVTGVAGAIGSMTGGVLLGLLGSRPGATPQTSFTLYFSILAILLVGAIVWAATLERLGAYSTRDVLGFFFSPRDLRAIRLLNRLSRSGGARQQQEVIHALGETPSALPLEELLKKLSSPRYSVRAEALSAMANLPTNRRIEKQLITEVRSHQYTTAHLASEIMGRHGVTAGIPALRESLHSRDYMLCAKSMVALAELHDRESIPAVEEIFASTPNPRLLIYGARALELFGSRSSLPTLLGRMDKRRFPFVRDEIILAAAGVMGIPEDFFYPLYTTFLDRSLDGLAALEDAVNESVRRGGKCAVDPQRLIHTIKRCSSPRPAFPREAEGLLSELDPDGPLGSYAHRPDLCRLDRFRFLVAAVLVWKAFPR